jgi:hypothetical protein
LTPSTNVVTASFARQEDHLACACGQTGGGSVAGAEDARRLDHDVDVEIAPGQAHGITLAEDQERPQFTLAISFGRS